MNRGSGGKFVKVEFGGFRKLRIKTKTQLKCSSPLLMLHIHVCEL